MPRALEFSVNTGTMEQVTGGPRNNRRRVVGLVAVAVILLLVGAAYGLLQRNPSGTVITTSTYYNTSPQEIVAGASQQMPSGYSLESSEGSHKSSGAPQNVDWAVLGQADGSVANLTVTVFPTVNASQSYSTRVSADLKGLQGYSDISQALSAYQHYGMCYGYGEDVDGIGSCHRRVHERECSPASPPSVQQGFRRP